MLKYILLTIFLSVTVQAKKFGASNIKHLDWDGIDVVYLQDERFPTYSISIYFADGALSDHPKRYGETSAMFDLLTAGTRRYQQKDILENLEFYGSAYGAHVTHEYSTYSISGLVKDIFPTTKKICHLFKDATFPKKVIKKEINLAISSIRNLVSSHGALANLAFRELSLKGTPYENGVEGKIKNLKRLDSRVLKAKLDYFNNNVKKKIYITGPKAVLDTKDIFLDECGWRVKSAGDLYVRRVDYKKDHTQSPTIYLVTVPRANQAQVKIGRYMNVDEAKSLEMNAFVSEYLGGGFTSKLMRELRTNRGLIYSGGAYAGKQRDYGRAIISTYTRNDKVSELLKVIKEVLEETTDPSKIDAKSFNKAKGKLIGGYPFKFESNSSFLDQLMYFDHVEKDYDQFYNFTNKIDSFEVKDLANGIKEIYDWKKMTIFVLGDKKLKKQLEEFGKVKVVDYKKFL